MGNQYKVGDVVLDHWTLIRLLGEGNCGRVFEAEREDYGTSYKSAIKIITIPQKPSEINSVRASGMDEGSLNAYFHGFVEEIVREFALMSRLEGTANVVNYHDHTVIEHRGTIGWDVLIRMEILTPLLDYSNDNVITQKTALKLGIDICRALEICQKFNILHRDIKPENIFVSELGDFKLGDFGIARTVEKTTSALSRKGTYTYMAPEVYRNEDYGSSVDIYSLGLVLYWMLNDKRTPFLPEYPIPITFTDQEAARAKRINGTPLPAPKNADSKLAEIIQRACSYEPKHRYASPSEMRQELEIIATPLGIVSAPPIPTSHSKPSKGSSHETWEKDSGTVGMFGTGRRKSSGTMGVFDEPPTPEIFDETVAEVQPIAPSRYESPIPVMVLPPKPSEPLPKSPLESFTDFVKKKIVIVTAGVVALFLVIFMIVYFAVFNNFDPTAFNHVEIYTISPNPNRLSGRESITIGLHVSDGLRLGRQEVSYTLRSSTGAIIEQGSTNVFLSSGGNNRRTAQLFTHYFASGSEYTLWVYLNGTHIRTFAMFGWF